MASIYVRDKNTKEWHKVSSGGGATNLVDGTGEGALSGVLAEEASGYAAFAEGLQTSASGDHSHAEGAYTIASSDYQHVQGILNVEDAEHEYLHIVGNGNGYNNQGFRSNAHTLDWEGNAWFSGDVYVGSNSGTNKDGGSKKLVTVDEMNAAIGTGGSGGASNVIMSETEPSNLPEGAFWDMIMTEIEPPKDMFKYTVTLTNGTGYTVVSAGGSASPVYGGSSYSFTVAIADEYQAGTGFAVKANGRTLTAVDGVYTINDITADQTVTVEGVIEIPKVATVTITGTGNSTYCYANINNTTYSGAASNVTVTPGSVITFGVYGRSTQYTGTVTINGSAVLTVTNQTTQTYNWTVPAGTKTISMSMSYTSGSYQRRGTITVTTT